MSWRCPKCGSRNVDPDTSCQDCGYQREQTTTIGKWVIVCPDCGREIEVDGQDSELEVCPECGNDSIETVRASYKEETVSLRASESPALHPRLFIQEIEATLETSSRFIYRQKGRTPEPISGKIEILPPEKEFGRHDLPELEGYYIYISEKHCKFRCDDSGEWFVSDTNSKNGTRVNGRPLIGKAEAKLTGGSEIQMANRLFIVFIE